MALGEKIRRDPAGALLGVATVGTAFGALLAAACNLLPLAASLLLASTACLLARVLQSGYRRLPEEDRQALLSRRAVRRTAAVAVLGGALWSCLYWYAGWWLPVERWPESVRQFLVQHWGKLDFVPAVFSQLLPAGWRSGFHRYFDFGTYCFPGPHWWESMRYLRAAIPGYAIFIFVSVSLMRLLTAVVRRGMR